MRPDELAPEPWRAPPGEFVDIPGRGTHFYRHYNNPGKPTLLLIHGMVASAGLNWFRAFEPLSEHFNIIAPDLRGHGRSVRGHRRFTLEHCVEDIAGLHDTLELGPMIIVGYSMGGAIAQRFWKKYPEKVAGLVFSAAGYKARIGLREQFLAVPLFATVIGVTRLSALFSFLPRRWLNLWLPTVPEEQQASERRWAIDELRRSSVRVVLESAREMMLHDASDWLGDIDVPTAVLVTLRDGAFSADHQKEMVQLIEDAQEFHHDDGHAACAKPEYATALTQVCVGVAERAAQIEPQWANDYAAPALSN